MEFALHGDIIIILNNVYMRGYSSVGRANGSQSLGRRFDPDYLHQILQAPFYFH